MSYCRFSSENFGCDVYVYEYCYGGWRTHVARSRVVGEVPALAPLSAGPEQIEAFIQSYRAQTDFMKAAVREPIGLPHDGEDFIDDGPDECADRLESLQALGYKVPQHVIEALRGEAADLSECEHDDPLEDGDSATAPSAS